MRRDEDAKAIDTFGRKKTFRVWLALCLVLVIGWLSYVTSNVIAPTQSQPRGDIDAVISLAPQHDRLITAEQIFLDSSASRFVVSYFPDDRYLAGPGLGDEHLEHVGTYCTYADAVYVTCMTPEDPTTLGETTMINAAAEAEAWEVMTVVTSKYHAFRTRLILDRCLDTDVHVDVVYSEVHLDTSLWLRYIIYENAAYLKAQLETLFYC